MTKASLRMDAALGATLLRPIKVTNVFLKAQLLNCRLIFILSSPSFKPGLASVRKQRNSKVSTAAHTMSRKPKEESYVLPPPAVRTIGDPGATFELHNIAFSHYCDRARWALRLLGIPYKECNYLPFAHMPAMATLLVSFGGTLQSP